MKISARILGRGLFSIVLLNVIAIVIIAAHLLTTEAEFQRKSLAINEINQLTSRLSTSLGMSYAATENYRIRLFSGGNKVLTKTKAIADHHKWDKLSKLNQDALENLENYEQANQRQADPRYISNLHNQSLLQLNLMMDKVSQIAFAVNNEQSARVRKQLVYLSLLGVALLVIFTLAIVTFFRSFVTPVVSVAARLRDGETSLQIGPQKNAVSELQDLILALNDSRGKLETKNIELERIVYTVSHELKSPLVTINGFAGMMDYDVKKGITGKFEHYLMQISLATDTMSIMLNELLELLRVGHIANHREQVSLDKLAAEMVDMFYPQLTESSIKIEVKPNLPSVFADRMQLRAVFQNLIENSIKFFGEQANPLVEIGAQREGKEVICFVRDNGVGIDTAYHKKVFGLFDRLDPKIPGTGVGLTLVRRIIELNGGRIWVESAGQNKGSTFFFSLPIAD